MPTDTPPAALTDPESLRGTDAVDVREETHEVGPGDFASVAALDSHVAVGVVSDRGVLLQNDGHHGWTLPAFPVADGEDWYAVARRDFRALTGAAIEIEAPERLRRRVYGVADGEETETVRDLVVRASPAGDLPADPDSRVEGTAIQWFDGAPDGVPDAVADDIALFVA